MQAVRGSEISDFLRCRKRWDYRWNQKLIPKKPNNKLFFGTLFHRFLEVLYQTKNPHTAIDELRKVYEETDTSQMEQTELDELLELLGKVCENYVAQWWYDKDENWKVIATELRFEIPLDEHVTFTGTIDLVYEREGRIYFADHKTTSSIEKYDKNSNMDRQISRYWWALQQIQEGRGYVYDKHRTKHEAGVFAPRLHGKPIAGFIYNIILKDFPVKPEPLKKGGLSKAKNQKTTYKLYVEALMELHDGYVPEEYAEILDLLQAQETEQGNRFFRRVEVNRLQPEIDAAIEEFYYTAVDSKYLKERLELGAKEAAYRNITMDCSWDCQFKEICQASMDGTNVDFLLDSLYTKEEK